MSEETQEQTEAAQTEAAQAQPPSKVIMAVICFLLGGLGIHRFVMGYTGMGILIILTLGGFFGILVLVDLVRILTGSLKMADGRELP